MFDQEFHIGDIVEILCHDGATFSGVFWDFTEHYVIINGYGFPIDDIVDMRHFT